MADRQVRIGQLRWKVVIAQRLQEADPSSAGILEVIANGLTVDADVQPLSDLTFYAGVQVDTPITHRIIIRWLDFVDTTCVVFRVTLRTDGSKRIERFRVRRVSEVGGRKRFLQIGAELEEQS